MATKKTYSTREVADLVGSRTWQVRRLFESGTLAEPPRFAGKRAIPAKLIPIIVEALKERGWLSSAQSAVAVAGDETELPLKIGGFPR